MHLKPNMVLNFLGLAGNMEDHGLELSPSGHGQIAPELEGAGSHLILRPKLVKRAVRETSWVNQGRRRRGCMQAT